ncbi:hypothetical protein ACFL0D_01235 [Thermoproteota archaeon]
MEAKHLLLKDTVRYLYENPELGSEEYKAFKMLTNVLEKYGFNVEKGVYGIPTAFIASHNGRADGLRVAMLAKYDAC